jgi:hypothetical protein
MQQLPGRKQNAFFAMPNQFCFSRLPSERESMLND